MATSSSTMILRPVVEQAVSALLSDAELAALLSISRSWIRKERMRRRSGLPHSLTIDPVMVGRCPRYRASDVRAWLENSQATLSPTDR
jgi:predicted DNA-binding transcriptional regulator AlpA